MDSMDSTDTEMSSRGNKLNQLQSFWPLRNLKSNSMSGIDNSVQNGDKVIRGFS